ncbi:uncharacterized protein T551_00553 [Pneumocystis jirovecii RU7]|uniref:Uncharacterized protein n=1 Tax=Pneumocystis jirovecii (strain RU7) TaxID=1408657 RepID=A0A0W4ZVR0_PNEJ7|nr:uncharacterized protein T551_00553 [Pneumocystis jirovecii RU7]KTW32463.1 hypothetical protein T551_00553 [Pneumocystis jirovecii RU7]
MIDVQLDANEKARLRRKARQEKILGHESERLTKIMQVSYPRSASETKKASVSRDVFSKTANQKDDEFSGSYGQNVLGNPLYPGDDPSFDTNMLDIMSFFEKNTSFLPKDFSEPVFRIFAPFLKSMFFSYTENGSFRSPDNPASSPDSSEPIIGISVGEKWWKRIHFVWMVFFLFKVVLGHTGFLGTLDDRLSHTMGQVGCISPQLPCSASF